MREYKDIITKNTFQQNLLLLFLEKLWKEQLDFKKATLAVSQVFASLYKFQIWFSECLFDFIYIEYQKFLSRKLLFYCICT